jgi:hypothetical protein
MAEVDFETLAKLEEAFGKRDRSHITNLLASSEGFPLLLRVYAVCMLEHIGDETVVPNLCAVLKT